MNMWMLTEGKGLLGPVFADENNFNDLQQLIFMKRPNHCEYKFLYLSLRNLPGQTFHG